MQEKARDGNKQILNQALVKKSKNEVHEIAVGSRVELGSQLLDEDRRSRDLAR